jgi:hypothetical protein
MSGIDIKESQYARSATLKLHREADQQVLTARLPPDFSSEELGRVTSHAYDLISKLTGHPCMSGRYKFVVDNEFLHDAARVNLATGRAM